MGVKVFIGAVCLLSAMSTVCAESLPGYFGTYTQAENSGKGIYRSALDLETGKLSDPVLVAQARNPSFLEIHPNGKFLYAVSEADRAGSVSAFEIDTATGDLKFLNQRPSGGAGPCHVSIDHAGKNLLVANYGSGSASVIPIEPDGRLAEATGFIQHKGSSVNPNRQKEPHAHSINVSPDDRFAFVADLGIDKIMIYRLDIEKGTIIGNSPPSAQVKPGAGPRHFAFHPNGKFAYVINEIDCTVTAFAYDSGSGTLTEIQSVTTLPKGFAGSNTCAEVRVHPSGKFLYGSNRGHDSIVVYRVDLAKGTLTFVEHETTDIKTPRNFNIDPMGKFCLVANQDSDSVVVFRIDPETGALEPTGHKISIPKPVCIRFLAPNRHVSARILVAYYSLTGNTEQMARGVVEGAKRVPGVIATLKKVSEVSKEDLDAADGIILGCPTYFANVPGQMKTTIDDWNWKMKVDFTDKVGGAFATAGGQVGGQEHVVICLLLFMLHNRMVVAGPLYRNEKTGSIWAESGAAAITGPLDPGVGEGELDGAARLGQRIASLAIKMKGHVPSP
jgi:6-phosphogluconolactonase